MEVPWPLVGICIVIAIAGCSKLLALRRERRRHRRIVRRLRSST